MPASVRFVRAAAAKHLADAPRDALDSDREARRRDQAALADRRQRWIDRNRYYYACIRRLLAFIVEPGARVLSIRCRTGDFLDAVAPLHGVGVEISQPLVEIARARYPRFTFLRADPEQLDLPERFDYVIVSDVSDTADVLATFTRVLSLCEPQGRVLVYGHNPWWRPMLALAGAIGLRMPSRAPNWLSEDDVRGLLQLAGFHVIRVYRTVLIPRRIPLVSEFVNRVIAALPLVSRLCLASVTVARPPARAVPADRVRVSVIVPCRNERGTVAAAVERMPRLGAGTEIVFCDDSSSDGTAAEVQRVQALHPDREIQLLAGPGIGKAENVWAGFRASRGDILIILDGDLTLMPEELPAFISALTEGRAEFANGSRLVYPVTKAAMPISRLIGNRMMSRIVSYLLDHQVKDTLCGTKALWRRDWERIEPRLGSWGVRDRWGDYELLFAAARLQLAIVDIPVHYQERVYGTSKMVGTASNLFRMLRMCVTAAPRLKSGG